ncbi:MAG TPA: hypothetical protein VHB21_06555, partial [Minicystis sp.]|nr:hypothetical protein [Minicystis sp.]
ALVPGAPIHTDLHAVHVDARWRWVLGDHIVLRAGVGYLQAVAVATHVDTTGVPAMARPYVTPFTDGAERTVDDLLRRDVKVPTVSLYGGYRF